NFASRRAASSVDREGEAHLDVAPQTAGPFAAEHEEHAAFEDEQGGREARVLELTEGHDLGAARAEDDALDEAARALAADDVAGGIEGRPEARVRPGRPGLRDAGARAAVDVERVGAHVAER